MLKNLRFYLIFLLISLPLLIWSQHPSWQNFTTNNGLPSNEVYQVIQDSRGYLWFATDQGMCRFNGYDFTRPVDTSVQRGGSAFVPTEDAEGNIWFARLDASLWIIQNDTVRAWKYNTILDLYKGRFMLIEQLAIADDGIVWIAMRGLGLLSIDPEGNHQLKPDLEHTSIVFTAVGNTFIHTLQNPKLDLNNTALPKRGLENIKIFFWENDHPIFLHEISRKASAHSLVWGAWRLHNGDDLYAVGASFFLSRNNKILWKAKKNMEVAKMVETAKGNILLATQSGANRGLLRYASIEHLRRGEFTNLLPGKFVTNVTIDQQGGYWATTHNAGIFYCKNPDLDIFDKTSGLPYEDIVRLTHDGDQTIFAGLRPSHICAIQTKEGSLRSLPPPPVTSYEIWALHFDSQQEQLWCSNPLYYLDNNQWQSILFSDAELNGRIMVSAKKISPDPTGNTIWMSAMFGFFNVDLNTKTAQWYFEKKTFQDRTFSVEVDAESNIWVATINGLRCWKNGRYELPPFDHPALRFPASDMKVLPNSGMAISLRGAGLLLRDSAGNFTHLTKGNGLTSDYLPTLYVSQEGVILACSNAGLNKISLNSNGTWGIETLTMKHGLPSNQVNDVTMLNGQLWVATDKGLAHFKKTLTPAPMPAPVMEKFSINNRNTNYSASIHLKHYQNYLSVRFFALHFRSGGDIPYRYRLMGADTTYIQTRFRQVDFANLPSGEYTFEVQAQNEDGQWSEPARWPFTIQLAWWQTVWFALLVMVSLLGGLAWFYRNRLRNIRRKNQIQEKVRQLESAALRAQMNPHFIFNCLSSIQQFILENDPAEATRYLTRFARLVRLTLHGSVDGQHSLKEEVDMLDNYLALEQLRFRGKFTYTIQTEPGLDIDEIFFPPMLVQPFVENALLHGMKNKKEGGRIDITFERNADQLLVRVLDNGPGISTAKKITSETGHKSVGMTLTQHRLEILSGKTGRDSFKQENILGPKGEILGSRVELALPFG